MTGARHDPRDDYADEAAAAGGWLDRAFSGESLPAFAVVVLFGLCLPAFPATAVLAALGVALCRSPAARHHATLLLVVAGMHAILLSMVLLDGVGVRPRF